MLLFFVAYLEVSKSDFHNRRPVLFLSVLFKNTVKLSSTQFIYRVGFCIMEYWKRTNFSHGICLLSLCVLKLQICIDTYFKKLKVTHIKKNLVEMRVRITFRNFAVLLLYCNQLDYHTYKQECFADAFCVAVKMFLLIFRVFLVRVLFVLTEA